MFDEAKTLFTEKEYQSPISKTILLSKMDETESARKIKNLLNLYESLARGVNLKAYDEKIVKSARRQNVINTYNL